MGHWLSSFAAYTSAAFWADTGGGELELPLGAIALWSDLNGATPTGWALCDGTANAPGPDLRNQFIVGWGTRTVDTTGGASTHVHADNLTHAGGAVGAIAATATAAQKIGTSSSLAAAQAHTHPAPAFTQPSAHGSHAATDHTPPFYVLKFIQRMT